MNLASKFIKAMDLQQALLKSDNQILITSLQSGDPMENPGDWRIRPTLIELQMNLRSRNCSFKRITRTSNVWAHKLAKLALHYKNNPNSILNCNRRDHLNQCPVSSILSSVSWGYYNPIAIICSEL